MTLDDVQILFVDLQPSLVPNSRTISPAALTRSAVALAEAAVLLQIPMTFSIVPEDDKKGASIPELEPFGTAANTFLRDCASAFLNPATVAALASHDRMILIVSGYAAEVVVLHSALAAIQHGYEVLLPVDAVGALSDRTEAAVFRQIERAGGTTTSVSSVLSHLTPDFSRPPGSIILETLKTMRPAD